MPEFEKRWSRCARRVHSSWRMDETAVLVRGGTHYLYRAVDKHGKTVDSLLCADRSESAARAFFSKALKTHQPRRPRKVNLDGNAASHRALRLMRQENPEWRSVVVRSRRYLNNIVLVTPKGGRRWRYAYRFARKSKTLSLGIYPDVPLERARSRHEFARNLLDHGFDPPALKAALGKHVFFAMMREWERARGDMSALPLRRHTRNRAD
jgi:DDE domain/Arm DNA-binding domain